MCNYIRVGCAAAYRSMRGWPQAQVVFQLTFIMTFHVWNKWRNYCNYTETSMCYGPMP